MISINFKKNIVFAIILWITSTYLIFTKSYKSNSLWIYSSLALHFISILIIANYLVNFIFSKLNTEIRKIALIFIKSFFTILLYTLSLILVIITEEPIRKYLLTNYGRYSNSYIIEAKDIDKSHDEVACACIEKNIKIMYIVDSKKYYQEFIMEDFYEKGDTLLIKYFPITPDIFECCPNDEIFR